MAPCEPRLRSIVSHFCKVLQPRRNRRDRASFWQCPRQRSGCCRWFVSLLPNGLPRLLSIHGGAATGLHLRRVAKKAIIRRPHQQLRLIFYRQKTLSIMSDSENDDGQEFRERVVLHDRQFQRYSINNRIYCVPIDGVC